MFTKLIDDILTRIIDFLSYIEHNFLLCSNKLINKFMLTCYFKHKVITNNVPISFYTLGYSNNLNILILFEGTKIILSPDNFIIFLDQRKIELKN